MANEDTPTPSQQKERIVLFCSFCGKSQHDVKKIVAGPAVQICQECVQICVEQLFDSDITIQIPSGNDVLDLSKKLDDAVTKLENIDESFKGGVRDAMRDIGAARRKLGDMIQFREEVTIFQKKQ